MDPRTRIGLLMGVGVLAITLDSPIALGLLAAATVVPYFAMGIQSQWWRRGIGLVLALFWSTVLSQGLFYADQPRVALLQVGPLALYREGVTWGTIQSLRLIAVGLAGLAVALSTPPDRMVTALTRLRVPYGLSFLAVTALRFVPVIGQEWWIVRQARARRGRALWRRTPWRWLYWEVALLRPVVARSLRRSQVMAETLEVRGFDPATARLPRKQEHMTAWETALLLVTAALVFTLVSLQVLYWLYTRDVLYLPALRPWYAWVRFWL